MRQSAVVVQYTAADAPLERTVVTTSDPLDTLTLCPTPRLVRAALGRAAAAARSDGQLAWLTPRISTLSGWIGELVDEVLFVDDQAQTRLSTQQAAMLWQSLVDEDVLVGEPEVAALAAGAWRLIHEYELPLPEYWESTGSSADAQAFQAWSQAYLAACDGNGWIDPWVLAGQLPARIAAGELMLPARIVLEGFERSLTPLQASLIDACRQVGVEVIRSDSDAQAAAPSDLVGFASAEAEFGAAVTWARDGIENLGWNSVALVVPDLAARLDQVERLLSQLLDPAGFALAEPAPRCWHVSLGRPLAQWGLVKDAMTALRLRPQRMQQRDLARLLASPYLAGSEQEWRQRAAAQARLARFAPDAVTFDELCSVLTSCGASVLVERLTRWRRRVDERPMPALPSEWVGVFQRQLSELGFGFGRKLGSIEYQCLQRWHAMLDELAELDVVYSKPIDRSDMLQRLTRTASSVVFREENTGAAIEVLGAEEAIGSRFDGVWVMSLDAQTWPGSTQRDPLIPAALQVQGGVPSATPAGAMAVARERLSGLLRVAPQFVGSFVVGSEDVAARPTSLLGADSQHGGVTWRLVDQDQVSSGSQPELQLLAGDSDLAKYTDGPELRGGVGLLRSQAACPFQAAARYRLGADDERPPRPGLGPDRRSTLAHDALAYLWRRVVRRDALAGLSSIERGKLIDEASLSAIDRMNSKYSLTIPGSERELERARLRSLLARWVALDLERPNFEVVETECTVDLVVGDYKLSGKFDRLDRLSDGRTLLIDYKLTSPRRRAWLPDPLEPWRIEEPQLPVYLLNLTPQPSAIAFAQIKPDSLLYVGLADSKTEVAGIKCWDQSSSAFDHFGGWAAIVEAWQTGLLTQIERFVAGAAEVDPADGACQHCYLQPVCRIAERRPDALIATAGEHDE